jgi:hypothetical protein
VALAPGPEAQVGRDRADDAIDDVLGHPGEAGRRGAPRPPSALAPPGERA